LTPTFHYLKLFHLTAVSSLISSCKYVDNSNNKKSWEELISCFLLVQHGPHRKQQFYCYMCIHCHGNVFTELFPSNDRGIHIQTHRLMGGIYEVCHWDGLRCHDIHMNFHQDWFSHSKVDRGDT
jgi:hypothetical protein